MTTAMFGPIAEMIFASWSLWEISDCDSYYNTECDEYTNRNEYPNALSSYISDVAGLAIASCFFVMSKSKNFYF